MKNSLIILLVIAGLMMCSWVDRDTIDVYDGSIRINNGTGYTVTDLSGNVSFYLDSYRNLGFDNRGYLYNASADTYYGLALINGTEYECRMIPNGGFQIKQQYYSGTTTRTLWIDYLLTVQQLPTGLSIPEFLIIFIGFVVFILVAINVLIRGFIL